MTSMSRPANLSSTSASVNDDMSSPTDDSAHYAYPMSPQPVIQPITLSSISNLAQQTVVLTINAGLPRDLDARELRSMFIFCPGVLAVERKVIPESGDIQAVVLFGTTAAAIDAQHHLNGKKYDPFDAELNEVLRVDVQQPAMKQQQPQLPKQQFHPLSSPLGGPFAQPATGTTNTNTTHQLSSSNSSNASSNIGKSRFASSFAAVNSNAAFDAFYSADDVGSNPARHFNSTALGNGTSQSNSMRPPPVASTTLPTNGNGTYSGSAGKSMLLESHRLDYDDDDIVLDPVAYLSKTNNQQQSTQSSAWIDGAPQMPSNSSSRSQQATSQSGSPPALSPTHPSAMSNNPSLSQRLANSLSLQTLPPPLIHQQPQQPQMGQPTTPTTPNTGSSNGVAYFMPRMPPNQNPADQNPPCNTLYVGNLPMNTAEDELKALFSRQPGYRRLCFRTKANGPMCFVEFEDVPYAARALAELHGNPLSNSIKGGIRLSFSKNPLGVRNTSAGMNGNGINGNGNHVVMVPPSHQFHLQQQQQQHQQQQNMYNMHSPPPGLGTNNASYPQAISNGGNQNFVPRF